MANLTLSAVDEMILLRKGKPGKPVLFADGSAEGEAIIRSTVVMLSASLQVFIEDVFTETSIKALGEFDSEEALDRYRSTWKRWGNPSADNITNLFRRLGIDDVLEGLSWTGQGTKALKKNLNEINQIRNSVAHGGPLKLNGQRFDLGTNQNERWRNVARTFGEKFPRHVASWYDN